MQGAHGKKTPTRDRGRPPPPQSEYLKLVLHLMRLLVTVLVHAVRCGLPGTEKTVRGASIFMQDLEMHQKYFRFLSPCMA